MPADKVRADYESLKQIAQVFGQQADATRQTVQQLRQAVGVLQQGDWVGKGADKFYNEMNSSVLPTVTRLQTALENASRVTTQISNVMKQAEDDAARVLRGEGNGAGEGPGGGAPRPLGAAIGAAVGGVIGGVLGGPLGAVAGAAAGAAIGNAATGGSGGTAGTPTSRMLKNLDPKVAELAEKSPTVKAQLEKLEKDGWTIVKGTPGGGSETDRTNKRIVIDPADSPAYQVGGVAHEAAHALYGEPPYHAPTPTMTRDEYVRLNVDEQLRNEGNSQFHETLVRDEILQAGGPDIGISGNKSAEYKQIYQDYKAGTLTRDQAIEKMGNILGDDVTSTPPKVKYRDYYGKTYKDFWDNNVAPGRRTP